MSAKTIIARYVARNSSTLPKKADELRQHLAVVAAEAKLKLTEEELDELAPKTEAGEGKPEKVKKVKSGEIKDEAEKSGDSTSAEI